MSDRPQQKVTEYLDDDGNKISKNAWKKLQKRKKSQAKQKAKANKQQKKGPVKINPEDDPAAYEQNRVNMVKRRMADAKDEPYPHKWHLTCSIPEFRRRYEHLQKGESAEDVVESVAGRIFSERSASKKLKFYDISADGADMQIMASMRDVELQVEPEDAGDRSADQLLLFQEQHKDVRRGDIVGFRGIPTRTKTGEISLRPLETKLLTPCLKNMPSRKCPITDQQIRYRQRYLDLLITEKTREVFQTRAKIIAYIRRYLDSRGFLEVETPILNQIPSGAAARPFLTKHNELNLPMYLRIAPELFLKMCVVGGLDRVYEIGRLFRNEGIDMTHNPEFTTCEFYWAYQDYNDLMDVTEELISEMVYNIKGTYVVDYTRPKEGVKTVEGQEPEMETIQLDFSRPWRRFDMISELETRGNMSIPTPYDSQECRDFLAMKCEEFGITVSDPKTVARMLDKLVEHFLEPECQNPAFIMNHPQAMSPLAKYHRSRPGLTERFECFVAGKEICNAYTELNNPIVQKDMFESQGKDAAEGDDEAMPFDKGFVTALEYGLPPTAGWGMGIDRLTMFLTNSANIKEVLLFPQNKPESVEDAAQQRRTAMKHLMQGGRLF